MNGRQARRVEPTPPRTTFETSRAAEYFTAEGLTKLTEQSPLLFGSVVVKELGDNALDAAETARVEPEVLISVRRKRGSRRGDVLQVSISDNGGGIPPGTVETMQDFSTLTSDKAHYRTPTRGSQGNALKTIIGIPHALGLRDEPVVIEGQGIRHTIKPVIDAAGVPRLPREVEGIPVSAGTRVTVPLPADALEFNPDRWARAFALFNPHAFVKIEQFGGGTEHGNWPPETTEIYKPAESGFSKYRPDDWGSPHWYDARTIGALIGAHAARTLAGEAEDMPLGAFISGLTGLSSPAKAKRVRRHLKEIKHLSDFLHGHDQLDRFRVGLLLEAMQEETKAPTHKTLGRIGADNFETRLTQMYGELVRFGYKHVESYWPTSGLPYIFEFAVAETEDYHPDALYYGINHSPTFDDPLRRVLLEGPKYTSTSTGQFLQEGFAHPKYATTGDPGPSSFTAVALHIITPAPMFTGKGKTNLNARGM
ncbi:MAG: hypothetical protein H0T57_00850 [Rubrobacter sp.]|nr:hypothetical protein [Rubrobacter sp.]